MGTAAEIDRPRFFLLQAASGAARPRSAAANGPRRGFHAGRRHDRGPVWRPPRHRRALRFAWDTPAEQSWRWGASPPAGKKLSGIRLAAMKARARSTANI